MKTALILLAVVLLANAAPPEKKPSGKTNNAEPENTKTDNKRRKPVAEKCNCTTDENDDDDHIERERDYCYDSSWSFKCRQPSPDVYELECKIVNADGDPCFPDLIKMIEAATPLSTISYPIHSLEGLDAASKIDVSASLITADNIEAISLQAPFERIPADAFAKLTSLKRITLETLDGVKKIRVDKHAFRNTTAKRLHLIDIDIRHFLEQHVEISHFHTLAFSGVEIECRRRDDDKVAKKNESKESDCHRLFENLKAVETMNLESIYVEGKKIDDRIFRPMSDTLKKLTVDVIYTDWEKDDKKEDDKKEDDKKEDDKKEDKHDSKDDSANCTRMAARDRDQRHFPVEAFAFMSKLEDLELFVYEPIVGLSIDNDTAVPLPVSKSLTRFVLSCRYCKDVDIKDLGKMLPNLHHLTIAAPLRETILSEKCLKSFTKLEELVIYDGDLKGIKAGAFRSTPLLKHLSIKYAAVEDIKHDHLEGLEDTLETLVIVGTPIKRLNASRLVHLTSLDVSQNRLTAIEREMLPEKVQLSELSISYNPIKRIEHGFLSGVVMKNHILRMNGMEIESFDMAVLEGVEKLWHIDLTQNLRMRKLEITDQKKMPAELKRVVVGRSPLLKLEDDKGVLAKMMIERNITLVVEGSVACTCKMDWMIDMQKDHPDLIEIDRSRAICSRQGTDVEGIPESFWKKPTVVEFLHGLKKDDKDKKVVCKRAEEAKP